ncbi:MAG: hypothetical protein ACJA0U_002660, partial [Salibacteraceae bacterium]
MLEVSKNLSDALFLKIFDGVQGVFTYYKLILDKDETRLDYRFVLVDSGSVKQLNNNVEVNFGSTVKEILPHLEKPW